MPVFIKKIDLGKRLMQVMSLINNKISRGDDILGINKIRVNLGIRVEVKP